MEQEGGGGLLEGREMPLFLSLYDLCSRATVIPIS